MALLVLVGLGLASCALAGLQLAEFSSAESQQHGDDGWIAEMERDLAEEEWGRWMRWKAARVAELQQPVEACHTSEEGDACHGKVLWAMRAGIAKAPDGYIPLAKNASFEDVQRFLHSIAGLSHVCPLPCPPPKPGQRLLAFPPGAPPAGIHVDDLLATTSSGFEWSRSSCDCGDFFIEFPDLRATVDLCAEACLDAA